MSKRGANIDELDSVIEMLASDNPLPPKYKDHPLTGTFENTRDCHIQNDWILIYAKTNLYELRLIRTGSHADLFR